MFKPKEQQITRDIVQIGQYFDWTKGGTPGQFSSRTMFYTSEEMPINYENRPRKNGSYAPGGPWLAYTRTKQFWSEDQTLYRPNWGKAYQGRLRVDFDYGDFQPYTKLELDAFFLDAQQKGAEAWNKLRPDLPDFSLANAVYELRETPRALKQSLSLINGRIRREALRRGKSSLSWAGEWYLAIQFGWLPLYRDVRNFSKAFKQSEKRLRQLIIDEGQPVKRRRDLSHRHISPEQVVIRYDTAYNPYVDYHFTNAVFASGRHCKTTKNDSEEVKIWAVAQFRYLLPKGPRTGGWKKSLYRRIMGGRLTPSAVYNMVPWTWLADYFTDLGEFIEAVSPGVADKLWADYAYVMMQRTRTRSTSAQHAINTTYSGNWRRAWQGRITKDQIMIRVKASPFGFGFKDEDLSLHQTAILGALGFSRLP